MLMELKMADPGSGVVLGKVGNSGRRYDGGYLWVFFCLFFVFILSLSIFVPISILLLFLFACLLYLVG